MMMVLVVFVAGMDRRAFTMEAVRLRRFGHPSCGQWWHLGPRDIAVRLVSCSNIFSFALMPVKDVRKIILLHIFLQLFSSSSPSYNTLSYRNGHIGIKTICLTDGDSRIITLANDSHFDRVVLGQRGLLMNKWVGREGKHRTPSFRPPMTLLLRPYYMQLGNIITRAQPRQRLGYLKLHPERQL